MEKKLNGFYRGKVVKHLSHGKCKVFVKGIYDDAWEAPSGYENLPDAEQIAPLFGGSVNGNGIFSYPNLGAFVLVGFFNGDRLHPFFLGAVMGGQDAKSAYQRIRPNLSKETIESGKDAISHTVSVGNSKVDMYEAGNITISVLGDATNDNSKIFIDGKGNVSITTTKKVQVTSPNIALESQGTVTVDASDIKLTASSNLALSGRNIIIGGGSGVTMQAPSVGITATVCGSIGGSKHTQTFN